MAHRLNTHPKLATLADLDQVDQGALDQAAAALEKPFLERLVLLPDVHTGYELPVGAVAALRDHVAPAYVGYDIGCGMCCLVLNHKAETLAGREQDTLERLVKAVPLGSASHRRARDYPAFVSRAGDRKLDDAVNKKLGFQLGALGGGNHFIEVGVVDWERAPAGRSVLPSLLGRLAVTVHSGSRGAGHTVAQWHMRQAKKAETPGFFRAGARQGKAYLADALFMQDYALANRRAIMRTVLEVLGLEDVQDMNGLINENHNHVEARGGLYLHRKGATPAERGQWGVIPGNMRDGVYLTRGLGNAAHLWSASHGAGRALSRTAAKASLRLADFRRTMAGVAAVVGKGTLDEAPMAYKDLEVVMAAQEGIVIEAMARIRPLVNVKAKG